MAKRVAVKGCWRSRTAAGLACVLLASAGVATGQEGRYYGHSSVEPGYGSYYHEGSDTAERARHWGYEDGLADGRRDRVRGHSFRPTQDDRFHDAPDHGDHYGMSRQQYKDLYRDAYIHGYERGYNS